jgi:hypothetical protein
MADANEQPLTAAALRALAQAFTGDGGCKSACAALVCPGWESMPSSFPRERLERLGSLRDPADEDPTVEEFHPAGTHGWSPDAPIALGYFPYNRCEVWRCAHCRRPFLRYTEYGGYYNDERIRELDAALLVQRLA